MKFFNRGLLLVSLLAVALSLPGRANVSSGGVALQISEGRNALENWDFARARKIADYLLGQSTAGGDPVMKAQAEIFAARLAFFEGNYRSAKAHLEAAARLSPADAAEVDFAGRVEKLAEVWADAKEQKSEHFVLRYITAKDGVLVAPALDTLEKAYKVMTADFGSVPGEPVLVEIYPSFDFFTAATGLSEEDLENSGTIAVCKYRRLMINSPRTLARGYAYRDTLAHEFVHFLVYQRFGDSTPIWLHEGIAKHSELRWRGGNSDLSPSSRSLLASALRQGELISFDRMHPSFAKLKTPSQGQLAFAEVATVIDYLIQTGGWDMVFRLCEELKANPDYRVAIRRVTGKDFDRFWQDWIAYVKTLGFKEMPGMEISVYEIRKGEPGTEEEADEEVSESEVEEKEEWRLARLGDLLRDRRHFDAAAFEYERARSLAPFNPRILNKVGLAYYLSGNFSQGLGPLRQGVELYPSFSTTYINLARSLMALNQTEEAERMFREALDLNPFNPIPYNYLIELYQKKGDMARAKKLYEDLKLISS